MKEKKIARMKDKLIEFVSIQLDKDLKEPLYVQLYEQIKLMIKQHLLSPGYKLPAVRNLAQILQVNPSTVVNAYKELEKMVLSLVSVAVEVMWLNK